MINNAAFIIVIIIITTVVVVLYGGYLLYINKFDSLLRLNHGLFDLKYKVGGNNGEI